MHARCSICSELFDNNQDISACPCGHTFHGFCLLQWFERNKSCPQCRLNLKKKSIIEKLFFDIDITIIDNVQLINEIASLKTELVVVTKEKNEARSKSESFEDKMRLLEAEKESLRLALSQQGLAVTSLKKEVRNLERQKEEIVEIKQETVRLQKKLAMLQFLQTIMDDLSNDVTENLIVFGDKQKTEQLLLWNAMARREMKKNVERVVDLEKELEGSRKQRKQLEQALSEKTTRMLQLENELFNKTAFGKSNDCDQFCKKSPTTTTHANESMRGKEKVRTSSDSENWVPLTPELHSHARMPSVPSLKIKTGVDIKLALTANGTVSRSLVIPRRQLNPESSNLVFDGLGGHRKPELFPVPKSVKIVKRKRMLDGKDSSSSTLDKFVTFQ